MNSGDSTYQHFKLWYSYAGLGSGLGSMQPVFRVTGRHYTYTLEQNSFYDKPTRKPQKICKGILRTSSIDSIIDLVRDIEDSVIYRTNLGVMSGGIDYISIQHDTIDIAFDLHNASDTTARKIVDILNSNLPAGVNKIRLFEIPEVQDRDIELNDSFWKQLNKK